MNQDASIIMDTYFSSKDVSKRYEQLKILVLDLPSDAKDFFIKAFKKERCLDSKLLALRGYANYASEDEVEVLTSKLMELLKKRALTTPYNYEEYERMRSAFMLPFLVKKYDYDCFKNLMNQLDKQYNEMPDCFKGIFTLDENGEFISLRDSQEVQKSWDEFWKSKR